MSDVSSTINHTLRQYKGLLTNDGRNNNFMYIHFKVLKKAIYGKVHLFVRVDRGQDGRYHVLNGRGSKVAVKQIFKRQLRQMINAGREMSEDPLKEVAIMLSLRSGEIQHRNVMNVLEVGEDANSIYIVLPFANGGELFDTIDQGGAQDEGVTAFENGIGLSHIHVGCQ